MADFRALAPGRHPETECRRAGASEPSARDSEMASDATPSGISAEAMATSLPVRWAQREPPARRAAFPWAPGLPAPVRRDRS